MVHTDVAGLLGVVRPIFSLSPDAGKGPGGLVAETVRGHFQYKPLR